MGINSNKLNFLIIIVRIKIVERSIVNKNLVKTISTSERVDI